MVTLQLKFKHFKFRQLKFLVKYLIGHIEKSIKYFKKIKERLYNY